jgi:hypothetical protein
MQRRLEDVSHFFFDRIDPAPRAPSLVPSQSLNSCPRVVYLAGLGDEVTAAMTVAGLAISASRAGRRVLTAETHEQLFGVAFGLGVDTAGRRVVAQAGEGLWVSSASLLGGKRPGVLLDQSAAATWRATAAQVDLALIHVNRHDALPALPAALPAPDEIIMIAGKADLNAVVSLYRTVKRVVSLNPRVELGVVAVGVSDERSRSSVGKFVQAVTSFLERSCPVVGSITSLSGLSQEFLSGRLLRGGLSRAGREFASVADRWAGGNGRRFLPVGVRTGEEDTPDLGRDVLGSESLP